MADSDSTGQGALWQTGEPGRRCNYCGKWKTLSQFSLKRANRSGRRSQCKDCAADAQRKRLKHLRETDHKMWHRHKRNTRDSELRTKVGITLADYEKAFAEQNGLCALCGKPETSPISNKKKTVRSLAADHDHKTGRFRGLLCYRCNRGIGLLGDDPELMEKAAAYVRERSA